MLFLATEVKVRNRRDIPYDFSLLKINPLKTTVLLQARPNFARVNVLLEFSVNWTLRCCGSH
jgi:hypothetical protein